MTAGLAGTVNSSQDPSLVGWVRLYNLTFIIGLAISFTIFLSLNFMFPPVGLGEEAEFVDTVLYGEQSQNDKKASDEELGSEKEKQTVHTISSQ